jgi:hypothetical protein
MRSYGSGRVHRSTSLAVMFCVVVVAACALPLSVDPSHRIQADGKTAVLFLEVSDPVPPGFLHLHPVSQSGEVGVGGPMIMVDLRDISPQRLGAPRGPQIGPHPGVPAGAPFAIPLPAGRYQMTTLALAGLDPVRIDPPIRFTVQVDRLNYLGTVQIAVAPVGFRRWRVSLQVKQPDEPPIERIRRFMPNIQPEDVVVTK